MYKRAAQIWQRLSKSKTLVRLLDKKRTNDEKKLERAKKNIQKIEAKRKKEAKRKANANVNCKICGKFCGNYTISEHMFVVHKLTTCKFCSKFMLGRLLHSHIKEIHGDKKYLKWLNHKSKKSDKQSENMLGCKNCNQKIESKLMALHLQIYCKNRLKS